MILLRLLLLLTLLLLPLVQPHHLQPSLHGPWINQPTLGGHQYPLMMNSPRTLPLWVLKHFNRRPLRDQVWLLLVSVQCRFILFTYILLDWHLVFAQILTRQLRRSFPEHDQEAGRYGGNPVESLAGRSQERWPSYLLLLLLPQVGPTAGTQAWGGGRAAYNPSGGEVEDKADVDQNMVNP